MPTAPSRTDRSSRSPPRDLSRRRLTCGSWKPRRGRPRPFGRGGTPANAGATRSCRERRVSFHSRRGRHGHSLKYGVAAVKRTLTVRVRRRARIQEKPMWTQWTHIAALTTLLIISGPALAGAQSSQTKSETYTWNGELVSLD